MEASIEQTIELLLLRERGEIQKRKLEELLSISEEDLNTALKTLRINLKKGGIELIETEKTIALAFGSEMSSFLRKYEKETPERDLTVAQAEVLSCFIYGGALTKGEVDEVRGVDSRSSLQELLRRGYVEQIENKRYTVTSSALESLGLGRREDAPDFESIQNELFKSGVEG